MPDKLMAPPIRTGLMNNPDGTPLTQASRAMVPGLRAEPRYRQKRRGIITGANRTARSIEARTSWIGWSQPSTSDRPDPANAPNGALYVESDRGVIYCNEGGVWQYVAGASCTARYRRINGRPTLGRTMADLSSARSTAGAAISSGRRRNGSRSLRFFTARMPTARLLSNPRYRRCYGWKPTAARSIKSERKLAIHRGHDVGNDGSGSATNGSRHARAGFDFRSTDPPPREFIWSQTAWVEITSISGGRKSYASQRSGEGGHSGADRRGRDYRLERGK